MKLQLACIILYARDIITPTLSESDWVLLVNIGSMWLVYRFLTLLCSTNNPVLSALLIYSCSRFDTKTSLVEVIDC